MISFYKNDKLDCHLARFDFYQLLFDIQSYYFDDLVLYIYFYQDRFFDFLKKNFCWLLLVVIWIWHCCQIISIIIILLVSYTKSRFLI